MGNKARKVTTCPKNNNSSLVLDEEAALKENFKKKADEILDCWFNVLVWGPTGVGKSSLVNTMLGLGVKKAEVGVHAKPCTTGLGLYENNERKLRIWDSKGLERNKDVHFQLKETTPNIIWFLLKFSDNIQEEDFSRLCNAKPDVPVIVIINHMDHLTQSIDFFETELSGNHARALHKNILEIQKKYPNIKAMIGTRLGHLEDKNFQPIGFDAVYSKTMNFLPDSVKISFAQNVRATVDARTFGSVGIILAGTGCAVGAAWIPVPFLDSATITIAQISMIIALYALWGVAGKNMKSIALASIKGVMSGAIMCGVGYGISMGIAEGIKLIPGIGTLVGSIIDSTIAGSFTLFLGIAILLYLRFHIAADVEKLTGEELEESIKKFVKDNNISGFVGEMAGKTPEEIVSCIEKFDSKDENPQS